MSDLGKRPRRDVIDIRFGAGSDLLVLGCGHSVSRNHRASRPKTAECINCPREGEGDQAALDMADHALDYLSIGRDDWTHAERLAFGRELLRYAALQMVEQ